ncbi:MAG TPA: sialate O-acetylesterase [Planctomycetaceae bacterium]|nr:sialate O-acetylesterase [Planctomycetaceae bacterium]
MKRIVSLLLVSLLFPLAAVQADVKLANIFSDHMVLQRDRDLTIWGWADPGEKVTVTVGDKTSSAVANDEGKWSAPIKALKLSKEPISIKVAGKNELTLTDILVGDVWLCSGQSNMEWSVAASDNPQEEIKNADWPNIRLIHVKKVPSAEPQKEVVLQDNWTGWKTCSPASIPGFSAVGYFFGRELNKETDVPIGLINSSWGGTRIEPWTPPVGFDAVEKVKDAYKNLDPAKFNHQTPTALYNGMIHGLVPFGIKGAIWYQGESNRGEAMMYHEKKKALIAGWRNVFENPDLSFYFVQLAPFTYQGSETALPEIWEAQTATLKVPNTGMAVITDIGNLKDIHPRNKQEVGRRLALWALAKNYGKDLVYSGPLYKSMKVEENKIRVSFDFAEGLRANDDKDLTWFQVAGEDGEFVDAKATIDNDTILVGSDAVASPRHVRFAWHQLAEPNLVNGAGLPASPFRSNGPASE